MGSIQTSPDPFEAEMTHCERLVRRGKQNLLAKVNLQKTTIEEQQNTIDDLQRQLNKVKIDGDLTTEDIMAILFSEHSAYDLLMQFIAFDAVMPSRTVRDNYLLDFKNEKSYSQKEAEDIACFGRFVGTHE